VYKLNTLFLQKMSKCTKNVSKIQNRAMKHIYGLLVNHDILKWYNIIEAVCSWKTFGVIPLISGSAIMELGPMCSIKICPLCTLFFTIRNFMSIYLDLDELLLFLKYRAADLLSQYNFSGISIPLKMPNTVIKFHSHNLWLDAS